MTALDTVPLSDARPRFWSLDDQIRYIRRVLRLPTDALTTQQHVARSLLRAVLETYQHCLLADGFPDDYLDRAESVIEAAEPYFRDLLSRSSSAAADVVAPPRVRRLR